MNFRRNKTLAKQPARNFPVFALVAQLVFLVSARSQEIGPTPSDPQELIEWVAKHWSEAEWTANPDNNYMRPTGDKGWKVRMLAMQQMTRVGEKANSALTEALTGDNEELQIFAAQTFGFLPTQAPTEQLQQLLKSSPNAAVRLYATDALGMKGGTELHPFFKAQLATEENRDVKKHLRYAIERDGAEVETAVIDSLRDWLPDTIDSATIGEPAPDFQLKSLNGETVALKDLRGESAVVLVFIYGDT
jgi:hypothetical protein